MNTDSRYRIYSHRELKREKIYSLLRDTVICAVTLGIIACTIGSVLADSSHTTLTSRADIIQAIQDSKTYDTHKIADYIAGEEGFSETPFRDPSGNGYVIGFGFKPRGRLHMSRKEGVAILNTEVKRLIPEITKVYGYVSQEQMTALVSILYNTPTYRKIIKDEKIISALRNNDIVMARKLLLKHSLRGIRHRRERELALFF